MNSILCRFWGGVGAELDTQDWSHKGWLGWRAPERLHVSVPPLAPPEPPSLSRNLQPQIFRELCGARGRSCDQRPGKPRAGVRSPRARAPFSPLTTSRRIQNAHLQSYITIYLHKTGAVKLTFFYPARGSPSLNMY